MKNSRDLILGEVVYIFIIYHILYSLLYLSIGYDFQVWSHDSWKPPIVQIREYLPPLSCLPQGRTHFFHNNRCFFRQGHARFWPKKKRTKKRASAILTEQSWSMAHMYLKVLENKENKRFTTTCAPDARGLSPFWQQPQKNAGSNSFPMTLAWYGGVTYLRRINSLTKSFKGK